MAFASLSITEKGCCLLFFAFKYGASQVVLMVKNLPANEGDVRDAGSIPGSGRSREVGMATHSRFLSWRIPWTEGPGGLQSIGCKESDN